MDRITDRPKIDAPKFHSRKGGGGIKMSLFKEKVSADNVLNNLLSSKGPFY